LSTVDAVLASTVTKWKGKY